MIKRTLYFGNPAYLNKKDQQLKITDPETQTEKATVAGVPFTDVIEPV